MVNYKKATNSWLAKKYPKKYKMDYFSTAIYESAKRKIVPFEALFLLKVDFFCFLQFLLLALENVSLLGFCFFFVVKCWN